MEKRIVIIGGGIHGLTTAIALADTNNKVIIIEKKKMLFQGTSGATHNRAHMGYHYPKSVETALECQKGLDYFKRMYPKTLFFPKKGYYIIAKEKSQTTKEEYIEFCHKIKVPCKIEWPPQDILKRELISAPFLSLEPIFNTDLLVQTLEKEATQKGVVFQKGIEVVSAKREKKNGEYTIDTKEGGDIGGKDSIKADILVNATYAYSNNILKICGLEEFMTEYRLQTTEVVVVKSDIDIPPLTIMDGRFISIMPYVGHENHYLVYDVENSVVDEKKGYLYDDSNVFPSNYEKMVEKGHKYFQFMDKLKYVCSLWGSRPIPVDSAVQSRTTRLKRYESSPGFYSILEGKFISAPLMAQKIKKMLEEDGLIK